MRRVLCRAVVVVAVVLVTPSCGGSGDGRADSPPSSVEETTTTRTDGGITWYECGRAQCGTLTVPVEHDLPDGPTFELALVRVPAAHPERRIGSLLMNPGGPGAPGTELARSADRFLPQKLLDRFDVVGWDPRGTGKSGTVDCGDELDYLFEPDVAPDDATEQTELEAVAARFAGRCADRTGAVLEHLSTVDTARDLDAIRVALGDERLTYLGYSYGSFLGAEYAALFPERVRAMVLDGPVDPGLGILDASVQQSSGFERAFGLFLADCADDAECVFGDGDPAAAYDRLAAEIEVEPIVGEVRRETRTLGPTQLDLAVSGMLYAGSVGWPVLADALAAAQDGDPEPLITEFDTYVGRRPDGVYDAEWGAFQAIGCADGPRVTGPEEMRQIAAAAAAAAPRFGASTANFSLPCAFWEVPATPRPSFPVSGAPPILVIATTNDPATPLVWAQGLVDALGSGMLVVVDGEAHTAFPSGGACLDDAVVAYLVDLEVPDPGLEC